MPKFEVIGKFEDKHTGEIYSPGAYFVTDDEDRITTARELGLIGDVVSPLPEIPPANEWPKHVAGGTFELSNGEKVKGKEAAVEAQKLLDGQGDQNAAGGQTGTPDKPE